MAGRGLMAASYLRVFARGTNLGCVKRPVLYRTIHSSTVTLRLSRAAAKTAGGARASRANIIPGARGGAELVFTCDQRTYFRLMTAGAVSQAIFWMFAASIAYDLRDLSADPPPSANVNGKGTPRAAEMPLAPKTTRILLSAFSLTMAALFLGLGATIPKRFTRKLELINRGTQLRISTYAMFGSREITVPANQVILNVAHPTMVKDKMCLYRIKGDNLFYFLDGKNGHIHSHNLFNQLFF